MRIIMKQLMSPSQVYKKVQGKIKQEWKVAFFSVLILGLCIHMPMILRDIPNHDGLDSMYFDQNMVTSGRWFLTIACGISSYFTLPWLIGLLAVLYLALTGVVLTEYLEVHRKITILLIGGLLAAFPAIASMFAYVFTMDGYLLGMLLAVLAPLCVKKQKYGYVTGGICLAFSLGIYQAYLPFAILLSLYGCVMIVLSDESIRQKIKQILSYLWMGIIGVVLYYVLLRVLLWVQGKELASYQGISGAGQAEGQGPLSLLVQIYHDFAAFTLKGNVLFENVFSLAALVLLVILFVYAVFHVVIVKKWYRSPYFYGILVILMIIVPVAANVILILSPNVTYHVLMRYQWVLFPILMLAFIEKSQVLQVQSVAGTLSQWVLLLCAGVLVWHYALVDNIAYSNLEKKYEKTYAYCLRLADRMEQTEGYYPGIPIAMIGVVSEEQYPQTDITEKATSNLIGIPGDSLLYTRTNYQAFMKHYMGITINLVTDEQMKTIYDSPEYQSLQSFPHENSMQVVDGILYIKLE